MTEWCDVFDGPRDPAPIQPVHDGRIRHAVHFRISSGCHEFSLSPHKSVNCSPYKPIVKPRRPPGRIFACPTKIIARILFAEFTMISPQSQLRFELIQRLSRKDQKFIIRFLDTVPEKAESVSFFGGGRSGSRIRIQKDRVF